MEQTCTQRQAVEVGPTQKPRQVVSLADICQLRHNILNHVKGKSRTVFQDEDDGKLWESSKGSRHLGKQMGL